MQIAASGDAALAEDVAHDAFLRVAAKRDTLRDPGAFEIYVKRAVVNSVRSLATSKSSASTSARKRVHPRRPVVEDITAVTP